MLIAPPREDDLSRFADRHLRLRLPLDAFLYLLVFDGSREGTFDTCYRAVLLASVLLGVVVGCLAYELIQVEFRARQFHQDGDERWDTPSVQARDRRRVRDVRSG